MPELPEVETTRRGIAPHVVGRRIESITVHQPRLRWPVPASLNRELPGRRFESIDRRAKYLLLKAGDGHLMVHLGMSGRMRVMSADTPAGKHDHLDIRLDDSRMLRFHDPRRFGSVLWLNGDPKEHPLLRHLGPEPLDSTFDGAYLYARSRGRKAPVKVFIMDSRNVVGVGNIYASEALYQAGIHPVRAAGRIAHARYGRLAQAIKAVLQDAIRQGGTTLRDYVGADGGSGYFQLRLQVYDRAGEPCRRCNTTVKKRIIGQRASFFCPACQR